MDDLVVNKKITIPAAELDISFARSGGPGGQHVNKTATKAVLRWNPGESAVLTEPDRKRILEKLASKLTTEGDLIVTSSRTRNQTRNREDARQRMAEMIRKALRRQRKRKKTRVPRSAKKRRLSDKRHRSRVKEGRKAPDED